MKNKTRSKVRYRTSDVLLFRQSAFSKEQAQQICKKLGKMGIILPEFTDFSSVSKKQLTQLLKKLDEQTN